MAVWPLQDSTSIKEGGSTAGTSVGTTVTASGTANTKGSWTQVIDATTAPASELLVHSSGAVSSSGAITGALFDIGIGAAASEIVLVPDIQCGFMPAGFFAWRFPVSIPTGSRISMRLASVVTSKTLEVQAYALGGGFVPAEGGDQAVSYGVDSSTSAGTALTAPGATNTKGAWTQLAAATTAQARYMMVTVQPANNSAVLANSGLIDIGVGGSGSEVVLIPDIVFKTDTAERFFCSPLTFPVQIPAGARLSARYQGTSTNTAALPRVIVTTFA